MSALLHTSAADAAMPPVKSPGRCHERRAIEELTNIRKGSSQSVNDGNNNIVLATAHPCKFPDAIQSAINIKADLPNELQFIINEKEFSIKIYQPKFNSTKAVASVFVSSFFSAFG